MTPAVAIALITKMKLIFETDSQGNKQPDKFLSFQNGSFPVAKENFYFIQPDKYGIGPIDTAIKMSDFANTFNFVAAIDDFIAPGTDALQDVYNEILKKAIPANNTRTTEQEERYIKAITFLNQPLTLESGETTPYLANYDKYEQLYKAAVSEYKNRELAAKNAAGEGAQEIKTQWLNDESSLKRNIERTLFNWETAGKRAEVEKYLGDFLSLSSASPNKTLADLKMEYELFTKATSVDHLANELNYIPTYFSPINFFEDAISWQCMSLDKSEVYSLVSQAPDRLKNLFDISGEDVDINNISFEYTVVEIIREWLHYKDFLLQPFWKLPADAPPLSDGAGQGKLPAFPEKLIFVRNVKVEAQRSVTDNAVDKKGLSVLLFQKLKPEIKTNFQIRNDVLLKKRNAQLFQTKDILLKDRISEPVKVMPVNTKPAFLSRTIKMAALKSVMIAPAPRHIVVPVAKPMVSRFYRAAWSPKALATVETNHLPPLPLPSVVVTINREMELLAFICSKVPVCPSPDAQLQWDA